MPRVNESTAIGKRPSEITRTHYSVRKRNVAIIKRCRHQSVVSHLFEQCDDSFWHQISAKTKRIWKKKIGIILQRSLERDSQLEFAGSTSETKESLQHFFKLLRDEFPASSHDSRLYLIWRQAGLGTASPATQRQWHADLCTRQHRPACRSTGHCKMQAAGTRHAVSRLCALMRAYARCARRKLPGRAGLYHFAKCVLSRSSQLAPTFFLLSRHNFLDGSC